MSQSVKAYTSEITVIRDRTPDPKIYSMTISTIILVDTKASKRMAVLRLSLQQEV